MTYKNVIDRVNVLVPNNYSTEQKVEWLNQAEAMLQAKIIRSLGTLETVVDADCDEVSLPENVHMGNIERIFVDGKEMSKHDMRSFGMVASATSLKNLNGRKIRIVYLKEHENVNYCEFSTSDAVFTAESISADGVDVFDIGSDVIISGSSSNNKTATVIGKADNVLYFAQGTFTACEETNTITVKSALNNELSAIKVYNGLYLMYLQAQICYFNRDFEGYNAAMTQYNYIADSYVRYTKAHEAIDNLRTVCNYW